MFTNKEINKVVIFLGGGGHLYENPSIIIIFEFGNNSLTIWNTRKKLTASHIQSTNTNE